MGGTHSPSCNQITRDILLWCKQRKLKVTISHLPGHRNVVADKASREFKDDVEWAIDHGVFDMLIKKWGRPQIDVSTSRLNYKVCACVSWKPDPLVCTVNAFTLNWTKYDIIYCTFPTFCLIRRVLQKIQTSQTIALMIVPQLKTILVPICFWKCW